MRWVSDTEMQRINAPVIPLYPVRRWFQSSWLSQQILAQARLRRPSTAVSCIYKAISDRHQSWSHWMREMYIIVLYNLLCTFYTVHGPLGDWNGDLFSKVQSHYYFSLESQISLIFFACPVRNKFYSIFPFIGSEEIIFSINLTILFLSRQILYEYDTSQVPALRELSLTVSRRGNRRRQGSWYFLFSLSQLYFHIRWRILYCGDSELDISQHGVTTLNLCTRSKPSFLIFSQ